MQIVCAKNDCYSELQIIEALWNPIASGQLLFECVTLLSEKALSVNLL